MHAAASCLCLLGGAASNSYWRAPAPPDGQVPHAWGACWRQDLPVARASWVAVKASGEAAVHALRAGLGRHAASNNSVVFKVDFRNAFNTVRRDVVLREVRQHFPALARWASWCYQTASTLQFGSATSAPLPVCSKATLRPAAFCRCAAASCGSLAKWTRWFFRLLLGWRGLGWARWSCGAGSGTLQQASANLGLTLNLDKSEAIAVGKTSSAALAAHLPSALLTHPDGWAVFWELWISGCSHWTAWFLEAHAASHVEAASKLLDAVGELHDPQVALRLLRASAGFARLVHTMRCCPPAGHSQALGNLTSSCKIVSALSAVCTLNLASGSRPPVAWAMLASDFAPPASMPLVPTCPLWADVLTSAATWTAATGWTTPGTLLPLCPTWMPPSSKPTTGGHHGLGHTQKQLSNLVDEAGWTSQLAGASAVQKATLLSEAAPGARAFLTCVPSGRTKMEPTLFPAEVRVRLGVPEASHDA